jgi:DNA-binding FadR family transcriptional regulator
VNLSKQSIALASRIPNEGSLRIPKTAELVAGQIRNAIIRGVLTDGDTLPAEALLIAEYQVSRPTMREAIRILESEGLITVSRGARGGALIRTPSYEMVAKVAGVTLQAKGATIGDLYEMRTLIEPPAARMVAERKSPGTVALLRSHVEKEFSLTDDPIAASLAIADFHRLMIEQSGNITLTMITHALQGLVERHLLLAQRREPPIDKDAAEKRFRFGLRSHTKLIDFIAAGDGEGAEKHWLNHMRAAGTYWLAEVAPTTVVELLD